MKYKEVVNEDNEGRIYRCEVEVCGYKVRVTNLVPKGKTLVMDDGNG